MVPHTDRVQIFKFHIFLDTFSDLLPILSCNHICASIAMISSMDDIYYGKFNLSCSIGS